MKTKTLIAVTITAIIAAANPPSYGATCQRVSCTNPPSVSGNIHNCKRGSTYWLCGYDQNGNFYENIASCDHTGCKDGYSPKENESFNQRVSGCSSAGNITHAYTCVSNAELCGECNSTTWTEIPSIPYATRTHKWCDGTTCKSESQVGCKTGYWGTPTAVGSGCNQCPTIPDTNNIHGKTGAIGATDITSCYVPIGTAFSNSTGSGNYAVTSNGSPCFYSK